MEEKAFNLLDERWIRVMTPDCAVREVSLKEALTQAHTFSALAGELPTQDMALLRILLVVLHAVFYRVDETGQPRALEDIDDALDRWDALWNLGYFPEKAICDYLEKYRERFYLFHPERPFWQVKEADIGTEFTAAKLNGAISESSNKVRLFSTRAGKPKEVLTYPEAARWLIYLNGYDDTSAKPKQKGLPSPGAGWLGKLGLIAAKGQNLFETLMLNFVMVDQKQERLWKSCKPIWELDEPRTKERCEIPIPEDQAQLLTLQSRRLLLIRDQRGVTGYKLLGGDFFTKVNAFAEQMTLWTHVEGKSGQPPFDQPRRHDPSKQIWREFSSIAALDSDAPKAGVVRWLARLASDKILPPDALARFSFAAAQYGDKDFFVADVFSDALSFHVELLSEAGKSWNQVIQDEIKLTAAVANKLGELGMNLEKAAGGSGEKLSAWIKTQFYYRIDVPFRAFLEEIDPEDDGEKMDERRKRWSREEKHIVRILSDEVVSQTDQTAFVGRTIKEKWKNKDEGEEENHYYNVPEACNWFEGSIQKLLGKLKEEGIMEMTDECRAVGNYVESKLNEYSRNANEGYVRAHLAQLRRGIGRIPGDAPEIWGILFADMPEEMMSRNDKPTKEEWAVYTALTLYALHQQGNDIQKENMYRQNFRLGLSVAGLVKDEKKDRERIAGRFNAFATANDMQEAAYYLRGLIQLLRAANIPLDYVRLAQELYRFQDPDEAPKVRLAWGQDFYRMKKSETKEEKENA